MTFNSASFERALRGHYHSVPKLFLDLNSCENKGEAPRHSPCRPPTHGNTAQSGLPFRQPRTWNLKVQGIRCPEDEISRSKVPTAQRMKSQGPRYPLPGGWKRSSSPSQGQDLVFTEHWQRARQQALDTDETVSSSSQPDDVRKLGHKNVLNGETRPSDFWAFVLKYILINTVSVCLCVQHVERWVLVGRGWRCHEGKKKEQGRKGILGNVAGGSMGHLPGSLKGPLSQSLHRTLLAGCITVSHAFPVTIWGDQLNKHYLPITGVSKEFPWERCELQ